MSFTRRLQRFAGLSFSVLLSASLGLGIGLGSVPQARADSLTTLFAANSTLVSTSGIVYFDLNVLASNGLTINSLDVNTNRTPSTSPNTVGDSFSLEIYTRTGTYSGFIGSSAGWSLVSTGSGIIGGDDVPVAVDVTDFSLGSGITGLGVRFVGASIVYTLGNGTNQNYSNASVALTAGASQLTPFSVEIFSPRVFNGTINYTLNNSSTDAPEPGSLALLLPIMGVAGMMIRKRQK